MKLKFAVALLLFLTFGLSSAEQIEVTVNSADGAPAKVYDFTDNRYLADTGQPFKPPREFRAGSLELDLVLRREGMANTYSLAVFRTPGQTTATLPIVERVHSLHLRTIPSAVELAGAVPGVSLHGSTLLLDTGPYLNGGVFQCPEELEIELTAEGYLPRRLSLTREQLLSTTYPSSESEAIHLPAAPGISAWYRRTRQERPWVFVPLLLLPVAGLMLVKQGRAYRQRVAKADRLLKVQADSRDPLVGSLLGGYRILQSIGSGGMATVYRAIPDKSEKVQDLVAIKILRRELTEEPDFLKRFHREVSVATSLLHPNIIETRDWGNENGLLFLTMELLEGRELKQLLKEGLSFEDALKYLEQVLEAVHFAHQRDVIHRDLKPGNILVTNQGKVKVLDFGLARNTTMTTVTATGNILGTPAYIPPEHLKGEKLDAKADQYSLGVMAYELVTGRLPFDDDKLEIVLMKHLGEDPIPPSSHDASLPPWLDDIILKMMAKDPQKRYADLEQVLQALRGHLKRLT